MTLLSKCVAGGFSAGVVLLWWPLLVPGDSLTAWLSRGVAFTLAFELLLLGLRPLEHALWATRAGTRLRARIDAFAARLAAGHTVRRLGSTAALAAVAVAIPAALIATGLHERPQDDDRGQRSRAPRVVRITKVVRPVKVERVVEAPAPATPVRAPSRTAPTARGEQKPARRTPASKPRTVETPARRQTDKPEELAAPKAETDEPTAERPERPASGSSTATQPRLG